METPEFDTLIEQIIALKNEVMTAATKKRTFDEPFLRTTSQFVTACESAVSNITWAQSEFYNLFPEVVPTRMSEQPEDETDSTSQENLETRGE